MPPSESQFEDTEFPADDTSVYKSVDKPEPERLGINHMWLRPAEFCEVSAAAPVVFAVALRTALLASLAALLRRRWVSRVSADSARAVLPAHTLTPTFCRRTPQGATPSLFGAALEENALVSGHLNDRWLLGAMGLVLSHRDGRLVRQLFVGGQRLLRTAAPPRGALNVTTAADLAAHSPARPANQSKLVGYVTGDLSVRDWAPEQVEGVYNGTAQEWCEHRCGVAWTAVAGGGDEV